jgi:hypothetical protein
MNLVNNFSTLFLTSYFFTCVPFPVQSISAACLEFGLVEKNGFISGFSPKARVARTGLEVVCDASKE